MTNPDIQNSRHLLKRLDEEMIFLSSLMTQINSLSAQVLYVSSNINGTWYAIDAIHKSMENKDEKRTSS
jgi:poly-D-alanine transfer protein DltD